MYMDDRKLFTKLKKRIGDFNPKIRIFGQDIGMEFGIENIPS